MRKSCTVIALMLSIAPVASAVSQAGGIVDVFVPSARTEAMAGSFALADPGPFALHGNPARMSAAQGAAFGYSHSQLVPDLAEDVFIDHWGLSYSDGRLAIGAMYSVLDQGTQEAYDEQGNFLGSFDSEQNLLQIGAGVDLSALFLGAEDDAPYRVRVGMSLKRIRDELAPDSVTQDSGSGDGQGTALDLGIEMQTQLLDGMSSGFPSAQVRVAVAYDNLFNADIEFDDVAQTDPLDRGVHLGAALDLGFLQHELGPLIGLTVQYEQTRSRLDPLPFDDNKPIHHFGFEVAYAGMASIRMGYTGDQDGDIQAPSAGVGLRLGWLGLPPALRLDYAIRPQSSTLRTVDILSLQGSWSFGS